jgi:multicomponent Na+:H+ antiporter subunit D
MIAPGLAVLLAIAAPLAATFVIWLLGSRPNLREAATLATGAGLIALTTIVFIAVGEGARPGYFLMTVVGGLPIAFVAEPLGAMFASLASVLWLINSLYSIGYMRAGEEKNQTRFYMCFAVAIAATMGVAYAANLFTLFIFYELLTLSTYPLVTHKGDDAARRGGRVYLSLLMGASIALLLPAIVWVYSAAGGTDFTPGGILAEPLKDSGAAPALLLGLFAFGTAKAALIPVHSWLPNAMVAPTPVSAFLHAVAVVKAGVFAVLKIAVYIFGVDFLRSSGAAEPYLWVAAASILLASAAAMRKDDIKARLAFSTVSQLSYVTLGAMLATSMGVIGGAVQIAAHAAAKMTLFMCAGAVYVAAHKRLVSEMRGLGRSMPITFSLFFMGALSIVGLPPFGGSWSKFLLMLGAADADELAVIAVLIVSALLNIAYLLSIPFQAFYLAPASAGGKSAGLPSEPIDWRALREAPLLCVLPPALTAAGAFLLFLFADPLFRYLTPILEQ